MWNVVRQPCARQDWRGKSGRRYWSRNLVNARNHTTAECRHTQSHISTSTVGEKREEKQVVGVDGSTPTQGKTQGEEWWTEDSFLYLLCAHGHGSSPGHGGAPAGDAPAHHWDAAGTSGLAAHDLLLGIQHVLMYSESV